MSTSFCIKIQPARCCYRGWIHSNWAWRGVPPAFRGWRCFSWRSSNWKLESHGTVWMFLDFFSTLEMVLDIFWIVLDVWKFIAMFLSKPWGCFFQMNHILQWQKAVASWKKTSILNFPLKIPPGFFRIYLLIADGQHTKARECVSAWFSHHHFWRLTIWWTEEPQASSTCSHSIYCPTKKNLEIFTTRLFSNLSG